jgi:hypothetical protein
MHKKRAFQYSVHTLDGEIQHSAGCVKKVVPRAQVGGSSRDEEAIEAGQQVSQLAAGETAGTA